VKGRGWKREGGDGEGKGLPGPAPLSSRMCPGHVIVGPCHMWCGHVIILRQHCVVVGPCCLLVIVACPVVLSLWLLLLVGIVVLSLLHHCCRPCLAMCHPVSE